MAREQSELDMGTRGGGGGIMCSSVETSGSNMLCLSYFSPDADELRCYPLFALSSSLRIPKIVDSCDGLLLLMLLERSRLDTLLLVCNPVTKSYELLPSPGREFSCLIYSMNWSIAYDALTKRYKVIGVTMSPTAILHPNLILRCMVFDFYSGSWKVVEKAWPSDRVKGKLMARVSRPGKLHWLIEEFEKEDMGLKTNLLSMDVSSVVFTLKTVPNLPPSRFAEHSTVSSGGRLYHTRTSPESICELDVWVMHDFDSPAWSMYHVLREKPPSFGAATSWNQFEVLGILQEGTKVIIKSRGLRGPILIYDIATKQWRTTNVSLPLIIDETINPLHDPIYHLNSRIGWKEGSSDGGSTSSTRESSSLSSQREVVRPLV